MERYDRPDDLLSYNEGYRARKDGNPKTDNPYPKGTLERTEWLVGWCDADMAMSTMGES